MPAPHRATGIAGWLLADSCKLCLFIAMSLSSGDKLGHYKILSPLGKGGMGEVYRARDSKLSREVAIKTLPAEFTMDSMRLSRFHREARALAALNHPNIAQIYGLEESEDGPALVMELVLGEPIRGPFPEEQALLYAKQIAAALEAAHEKGIIHRDLKPANIMLTPDGVVKILDFGLAAIRQPLDTDGDEARTLTMATQASVIMGTPGYMSPEQASGRPVDKRTDIFAFGVVVYEILMGRRLFSGDSASQRIAAVLTETPDLAEVPVRARELIRRCLEKDPKNRLRDIGDAFLIEAPAAAATTTARPGVPYWVAAVGMLASGLGAWFLHPQSPSRDLHQRVFSITPEGLENRAYLNRAVISPNGKHIVYVAGRKLWIRDLAKEQARLVEDVANPEGPFWSPDSSQIGFAIGLDLKKVKLDGGPPVTLAKLPAGFRGGAWSPDGKLLLVATLRSGLSILPAEGGSVKQVLASAGSLSYYSPHFIPSPSGAQVAVASKGTFAEQTLEWVDLAAKTSKTLRVGAYPSYSPSGHVLFQSEPGKGDIWALAVQPGKGMPDGDAVPIPGLSSSANVSVSADGVLLWADFSGLARNRFVWRDRRGTVTPVAGEEPGAIYNANLSPDGTRVAYAATQLGNQDIWISDLRRSTRTRFTFGPKTEYQPRWAPSGKELAFSSTTGGRVEVFVQTADGGAGPRAVETGPFDDYTTAWSPDGLAILFVRQTKISNDLWFTMRKPDGAFQAPKPFLESAFNESRAVFSPDGCFVAYVSDEAGREEIFVRSFPDGASKWQVSLNGGGDPRWSRDGKEIFYLSGGGLFAVPVVTQGAFTHGSPAELFRTPAMPAFNPFDVAPDAKRFLFIEPAVEPNAKPLSLHVVENGLALLKP